MFLRLVLLLTVVPVIELTILLRLAERFSWGPTIALVLLTGVLGAWLARREGVKAFARMQAEMARGEAPTGAMMDGFLILVAGVVLVTPGILTDLLGFALLIPPCRSWIRKRLAAALQKRVVIMHQAPGEMFTRYQGGAAASDEDFIDVPGTSRDAAESNDTPRIGS